MYITVLYTTEVENLCNSRKIVSNGQYSFSFSRLLFVLVGGSFVIVLSNMCPPLIANWQVKSRDEKAQHRRREWAANGVLHLQSIALNGKKHRPLEGE